MRYAEAKENKEGVTMNTQTIRRALTTPAMVPERGERLKTNLDTDLLILGEILPSLPEKVLCREDCKGLCPMCGKNLNEGACGCRQEPSDPRMAQIQDIFKTFNLEES